MWEMTMQLNLLTDFEADAIQSAHNFYDEGRMRSIAPALFTTHAHPKMSERYAFTNTYDIVKHIAAKGFGVTSIMGGTSPYNKMMIRMRNAMYDMRDGAPELVIVDSHDGTSRLKMVLGW